MDYKEFVDDKENNKHLYEAIEEGNYEPFLKDDRREWVEKQRIILTKAMKDSRRMEKDRSLEILFSKKYRPYVDRDSE